MRDATTSEVNLSDFYASMHRSRWPILIITVLCTGVAALASVLIPSKYEATVLMSPVAATSGSGLMGSISALTSQFGGLASLAGVSPAADSKKAESIAVLQSDSLTSQFIRQNDLLPILFPRHWDALGKRWDTVDPKKIPTVWKANQLFKKRIRTVNTATKTGLVSLSITWSDPILAAKWANDLVRMTNDFLREKAIKEAEANIAFLNEQAQKTNELGIKQGIYNLIQSEISKAMLARSSNEFAMKVVDPAIPPEKASFPDTTVFTAAGAAFGLLAALCFAFLRIQ